jgi:hypothetical protein
MPLFLDTDELIFYKQTTIDTIKCIVNALNEEGLCILIMNLPCCYRHIFRANDGYDHLIPLQEPLLEEDIVYKLSLFINRVLKALTKSQMETLLDDHYITLLTIKDVISYNAILR